MKISRLHGLALSWAILSLTTPKLRYISSISLNNRNVSDDAQPRSRAIFRSLGCAKLELKASGRCQDKRGRHRSAAIPTNELAPGNVSKTLQNVATRQNFKIWQHVRTQSRLWQNVGNLWPFRENPVCPEPVWKPVIARGNWSTGFLNNIIPYSERIRRLPSRTSVFRASGQGGSNTLAERKYI